MSFGTLYTHKVSWHKASATLSLKINSRDFYSLTPDQPPS